MSESADELTMDKLKQKLFVADSLVCQMAEEMEQYVETSKRQEEKIDQLQATIVSLEEGITKLESSANNTDEYNPYNTSPVEAQLKSEVARLQIRYDAAKGPKKLNELKAAFEKILLDSTNAYNQHIIHLNQLRLALGKAKFCSQVLPHLDQKLVSKQEVENDLITLKLEKGELIKAIDDKRKQVLAGRQADEDNQRELIAGIATMSVTSSVGLITPPPKLLAKAGSTEKKNEKK